MRFRVVPQIQTTNQGINQEKRKMLKKTVTAIGIAALAGAGAMSVLPYAVAKADTSREIIELAQCKPSNPCAAKKGSPCNPCAAKKK